MIQIPKDADFESILLLENNEKKHLDECYKNKYQKHIACSYDNKLAGVDNKFSKSFKSYLREDAVYNFINNMIRESKYCTDINNKYFNEELVMTKKDHE